MSNLQSKPVKPWNAIPVAESAAPEIADRFAPRESTRGGYWSQVILALAPLLVADLLAVSVSVAAVGSAIRWGGLGSAAELQPTLLSLCGATLVAFALCRLYQGIGLNPVVELRQASIATTLVFAIFFAASCVHGIAAAPWLTLAGGYLGTLMCVPLFRLLARSAAAKHARWGQPLLVFGGDDNAKELYDHFKSQPHLGLRPVGIIDDWFSGFVNDDLLMELAEQSERARWLTDECDVHWAAVTAQFLSEKDASVVQRFFSTFPHVLVFPDVKGLPSLWHQACDGGNLPGFHISNRLILPLPRAVKRLMDYSLVIGGGILCLPLIAIIALVIKLSSPGPVFYSQERVGKGNRRFRAWKFRTMVVNADQVLQQYLDTDPRLREEWERDHKLKNDPRVTTIGRWLRITSLDELPQIWNVLCGEMSLVGPRPIVTAEIPKYGDAFELLTRTMPGITGFWQVSGRNNTSYQQRVALDSYYAQNWSPWLDLWILAKTVKVVLRRDGAY